MTKDPKKHAKEEVMDKIIDETPPVEEVTQEAVAPEDIDWQQKSEEYLNDLKRLQADFENYKKRMANEQRETMRFITTGIISDLVPILDNFNMAVAHVPEDKKSDSWVTGITYIEKQFEEVIAGYGVDIMEVKVGDAFDPTRHEAVSTEETSNNNQETNAAEVHKIAKVLQKGYLMGDKVIRAAKVVVN